MNEQTAQYKSNNSDRFSALRKKAATIAEIWQPESGETLVGVYTGNIQVDHPRYGLQWQIFLKDEDGTTYAVWANPWIRNALKAQDIAVDDMVAITYHGKKKSKSGATYNSYGLIVDKTFIA